MISYNTYLRFLRFTYPEKSEEQVRAQAKKYMKQQHEFYRGQDERRN